MPGDRLGHSLTQRKFCRHAYLFERSRYGGFDIGNCQLINDPFRRNDLDISAFAPAILGVRVPDTEVEASASADIDGCKMNGAPLGCKPMFQMFRVGPCFEHQFTGRMDDAGYERVIFFEERFCGMLCHMLYFYETEWLQI